jgi:hypothetical protein
METLVECLKPEKVGWRRRRSGRPLALPGYGRRIIRTACDSALTNIEMVRRHIMLNDSGCQLQIGVGDLTAWIGEGDQVLDHILRKGRPPENRTQLLAARDERSFCGAIATFLISLAS